MHYSAVAQLLSLITIFIRDRVVWTNTPEVFKRSFGGWFQNVTTLLILVSYFWHVKPYDSSNLKLAGCLWKQCTLSLAAWHPPYKGWREKSNAMLSWCPTEGALPPGGNESRGGLLPVDLHVWEALDFKAKLPDYTAIQGVVHGVKSMGNTIQGLRDIILRDKGKNTSHNICFLVSLSD